jgi:hypothetical protein
LVRNLRLEQLVITWLPKRENRGRRGQFNS